MSGVPASEVDVVRRAYAALASNNMLELEECFAHDAIWHEPGDNVFSGDLVGWPAIRDELLALLVPLSHDTFRTQLVDIAVGQKFVVGVHRATGGHNGRTMDSMSCQLARVVQGRIQEVWVTHVKQAEVDAFWT